MPENRPTAEEIKDCLWKHYHEEEIIKSAEAKRQEIIKSEKYLIDTKNYKHHPESFYTSHLLNKSIQQVESLLNLSSTEIGSKDYYIKDNNDNNDNNDGLSDTKSHKHHSESFYTTCPSSGPTQQAKPSNFSSIGFGSKIHHIKNDGNDNSSVKEKSKTF